MAITRVWQAGGEPNLGTSYLVEFSSYGSTPLMSTSVKKTGLWSYHVQQNQAHFTKTLPASYTQLRMGFHVRKANDSAAGGGQYLLQLLTGATRRVAIYRPATESSFRLWVNGSLYGSLALVVDTWYRIGLDIKKAASGGWVKVCVNGVEALSLEGNTAADAIDAVKFGPGSIASADDVLFYFDDVYLDNTVGEGVPESPPDLRFEYVTPDGNGSYSQWTGSDGNQVDNYLQVDERPHDGDTTFNECEDLDYKDAYAMTTVSVPGGWKVAAVIPTAIAKKTSGGAGTQLALMVRQGGADDIGSAQDMPTAYGLLGERFGLDPGGGVWSQADLDSVEVGTVGKGVI